MKRFSPKLRTLALNTAATAVLTFTAISVMTACTKESQPAQNLPHTDIPVAGAYEVLDGAGLAKRGIQRVVDKEAAVVCYLIEQQPGIVVSSSCLPLSSTGIRLLAASPTLSSQQ